MHKPYSVTAAKSLIFNSDGKMLLLVRSSSDSHAPNRYDLPGGGVDPGEDFTAAAKRELFEEAGITVGLESLQLVYAGTSQDYPDRSVNRLLFLAKLDFDPTVHLSHEHSDYTWVTIEEAIKLFDHPFYRPGMIHVLERGFHQ